MLVFGAVSTFRTLKKSSPPSFPGDRKVIHERRSIPLDIRSVHWIQDSSRRNPNNHQKTRANKKRNSNSHGILGCPRKLGSMVSKRIISPTYKWGILGLKPTDPNH